VDILHISLYNGGTTKLFSIIHFCISGRKISSFRVIRVLLFYIFC
jgi:hypothetical protein